MITNSITTYLKSFYLAAVSKVSKLSKNKHNNIIILLSFESTSYYFLEELYKIYGKRLVVIYTSNCTDLAKKFKLRGCQVYSLNSLSSLFTKIIPLLKGAKVIICDNYFPILGGIDFCKETKILQIWHANGAIKTFGLEANYAKHASDKNKDRYRQVYKKITDIVVSSSKMADIFKSSYQIDPNILKFGYPLTDYYLNEGTKKKMLQVKENINKKIILYAPTYREHSHSYIDLGYLSSNISDDSLLLVHPHPRDNVLKEQLKIYPSIKTHLNKFNLQETLFLTDVLITDYSSIPFEYSLANPDGNIVFFCPDLDNYKKEVGLQADFFMSEEYEIVENIEDVVEIINKQENTSLKHFNLIWNEYANGKAIKQLIEWIEVTYEI
ncbi:CDP-glycerol glycerophosphotransferase family protein [Enterococcus innesii]|uniref:CDP-glycerol glycerophosphotransferase n=1 Tax=Enterococcus innesii TaxID=2839759 RepID=A0ABN6NUS8_9ENTE|nr:CDP-glycerol glycerophosphotransferase family protein [Enterococcus innesii]BDG69332.1 CDP-glycerol glycerophosphotransferase [Enterococcus innesii]